MRATISTLALVLVWLATTVQAQTQGTVSSRGIVVRGTTVNRPAQAARMPRVAIPLAKADSQRESAQLLKASSRQVVEEATYADSSSEVTGSTPLYRDSAKVHSTARPVYYTANQQTVVTQSPCTTCGSSPCVCESTTTYYQQATPVPTLSPNACCDPCNPCATCTQQAYAPCCPTRRVGLRPVIDVGTRDPCLQVGRGILGQPKVYVPGQPVRNFVRWITP